jgi:hypothetical protein
MTLIDESAQPVEIGITSIDMSLVIFAEQANIMLKNDLNLSWQGGFHTPSVASGEITINMNDGWVLKLSDDVTVDEIRLMISALFEDKIKREELPNLEYLDLRVKGKAYFKFR